MRALVILAYIVSFLLCFFPSGAYALDVYGIEVGNSQSFQGTYLTGEAQVQNPSFEQGKAGWFMSQTSGTNCSFTIDPDAYEGSYAAKLNVTDDGYCMLGNSTSIPIQRSGTHILKLQAKVSGDVDHLTIAVYKSYDADTNPDVLVDYINPNAFSGSYQLHQLNMDLFSGEYIRLEIGIDNNASGPSYALFDKIELVNPSGPYSLEKEAVSLDPTTFSPTTTHVIEYTMDGSAAGKDWFETTFSEIAIPSELRLWGEEDFYGDFYRYSSGLVAAWYPVQVNDNKYSLATIVIEGYTFNASLTADVLAVEPVDVGFDTFEAYKVRYKSRIWGYGQDVRGTFYYWWVPYLGFVKYQDEGISEVLTDFVIGGGTISQGTDTDNDGLKDYEELIKYNTDRLNSDTDADALTDGDEVNTHGTDPNDSDSDDDGLSDGEEINTYGTDPNSDDTDNDGLSDSDEINIYNTDPNNEDTDGDGLQDGDEVAIGTDPANDDTDGDGLADGDEVNTYGTNPNNEDTDGDGVPDKEEVDSGRHPANWEPETPVLALPIDGATGVDLAPTLETDAFNDTDGNNHAASEWQISSQQDDFSDDMLVFKAESELALTAVTVPNYILDENTTYYWTARFRDDGDAASEWAAPFEFTTGAASITDNNSNGIPDSQDLGPDESQLDLNDDGTFDDQQQSATWKCLNTVVGDSHVGIEGTTNVVSIDFVESIDPSTIADTVNRPDSLPAGLISFSVTVPNDGDSADVTIYLYGTLAANMQWYKWNPISGWQPYPASFGTTVAGNTYVELTLTDGGEGDADGLENGLITDPSGAGAVAAGGGGGGGGGGGCFISTASFEFSMSQEILAIVVLFGFLLICRSGLKMLKK
jgi:hypothetical protein